MIAVSHNSVLVVASIAVSLVAAFTGLAITNNIAALPETKRKMLVVMSAFIIGGGIWSMHFVAMLAHEISVPVYYDSLQTLGSALIAILVVGAALLMLHFSNRTPALLLMAGLMLGAGVIVMHYVGMLAIRGVVPQFGIVSVILAMLVAAVAGVTAIRVAYGYRSRQNIVLGSVVFGFAVAAVHYAAMLGTTFEADDTYQQLPVAMANHTLAISVAIASFVICGAFLLATTSFLTQTSSSNKVTHQSAALLPARPSTSTPQTAGPTQPATQLATQLATQPATQAAIQTVAPDTNPPVSLSSASIEIPFEKDKKIGYLETAQVAAVRADGHYTKLYTKAGVYFCPWSITEAEGKLVDHNFHRTHRSYLVNIDSVHNFEKRKDAGVCLFEDYPKLTTVPVSRSRVMSLLQVLEGRLEAGEEQGLPRAQAT